MFGLVQQWETARRRGRWCAIVLVASVFASVLAPAAASATVTATTTTSVKYELCRNGYNQVLSHDGALLPVDVCFDEVDEYLVVENTTSYWVEVTFPSARARHHGRWYPNASGHEAALAEKLTGATNGRLIPPGGRYTYELVDRSTVATFGFSAADEMMMIEELMTLIGVAAGTIDDVALAQSAFVLTQYLAGTASWTQVAEELADHGISGLRLAGLKAAALSIYVTLYLHWLDLIDTRHEMGQRNGSTLWISSASGDSQNAGDDGRRYFLLDPCGRGDAPNPRPVTHPKPVTGVSTASSGTTVEVDVDNDGYLDVVAFHQSGPHNINVWSLHGSANGKLTPRLAAHLKDWSLSKLKMTAADVNHDGYGDVVVFHPSGSRNINVWTFTGAADGTLTPRLDRLLKNWDLATMKLTTADVDLDGHSDVVTFHRSGSANINVNTFRGQPNGRLRWHNSAHLEDWSLDRLKLTSADVNLDGHDDVVVFHPSGAHNINVWSLTGQTNSKFRTRLAAHLNTGSFPR
jgi:hypothetical protein